MTEEMLRRIRAEQLAYERRTQAGLATWAQFARGGWTTEQIRTALRHNNLIRVLPRVYAPHTGSLSRLEREWAAVLWADPGVLVAHGDRNIHVAVSNDRRLTPPPGIVVHRLRHLESMVRMRSSPPRLALEHALLVRASSASTESDLIADLSGTIGRRGVTASHVRDALTLHPRLPRRHLITALLADIENGTESVLEHGYLTRVERPHGLPCPRRQSPRPGERRDLEYERWGLVVELDGRLGHDTWKDGNRDAARDLADVAMGRSILRLRWHQVMERSCATAGDIARALQLRGWSGAATPCSPDCAAI